MVSKTILSIINEAFPCSVRTDEAEQFSLLYESPQTFLNPEI